jgi:hypothetical protein
MTQVASLFYFDLCYRQPIREPHARRKPIVKSPRGVAHTISVGNLNCEISRTVRDHTIGIHTQEVDLSCDKANHNRGSGRGRIDIIIRVGVETGGAGNGTVQRVKCAIVATMA